MLQIFPQIQHQITAQHYWTGLLNNFMTNSHFDTIFYSNFNMHGAWGRCGRSHIFHSLSRCHNQSWSYQSEPAVAFSCMYCSNNCIFPIVINIRIIGSFMIGFLVMIGTCEAEYAVNFCYWFYGSFFSLQNSFIGMQNHKSIIHIKRLRAYLHQCRSHYNICHERWKRGAFGR